MRRPASQALDVRLFERLVRRGRTALAEHDPARASYLAAEALAPTTTPPRIAPPARPAASTDQSVPSEADEMLVWVAGADPLSEDDVEVVW